MKKLALVFAIVLAAAGLWWWESPRLATENLLDAARDGDVEELAELVDPDRFQASLRAELIPSTPIRGETSGFAGEPAAIVPPGPRASPSAPAMDPLLAGLAGDIELIRSRDAARTDLEIDRRGLNSFRVLRRAGNDKSLPALLFARDGLHWKLVGVEAAS